MPPIPKDAMEAEALVELVERVNALNDSLARDQEALEVKRRELGQAAQRNAELTAALAGRATALEERERRLAAREEDVSARTAHLDALAESVSARQAELEKTGRELAISAETQAALDQRL